MVLLTVTLLLLMVIIELMKIDILIVGFGPGTVSFINNLSKKKINNNVKVTIIEKNIKNLYGGIAYSKNGCEYGFFNNPLRLSPANFRTWLNKKKNRYSSLKFLENIDNYSVKNWLSINKELFLKKENLNLFNEIYLPRVIYSFFLEDIFKVNNKIKLNLINGKLLSFKSNKGKFFSKINFKKNHNFINKNFVYNNKIINQTISDFLIINTSIVEPKNFGNIKNFKYISSFYEQGATSKLIKLIYANKKKIIKIGFLGSKAGFLEPLIEIYRLIKDGDKLISITSFSQSGKTLEPASRLNFKNIKLFHLEKLKLKNKIKAIDIYKNILKEFKHFQKTHNKYDVWTKILSNDIIKYLYLRLSSSEKYVYSNQYFKKIRQITRFTYPETVNSYKKLKRNNFAKIIKSDIVGIENVSNGLIVKTKKGNKIVSYTFDILVNVTGINKKSKNINKKSNFSINDFIGSYTIKHEHELVNNLFIPSTFALNFNPSRYTILKAVTINNRNLAAKIYSKLKCHSK